ncbi:DNA mismatch repair endonuclease MutL [Lentisphaerota bacterium ZTH]|nr:DNA mismatch repair endonuclease MutL [Lentisphaerota bacterium]WET06623.1 DNA mismatch repair endonuclease MutL [Lentisphaerota bacterium ZTH]
MSKIKILPEQLSNRIAAGEVIERPASVVKELAENAIDAGASSLLIEIENAGRKLIAVTDNGSGMDQDDALLCLEAHATSKIYKAEDIDNIKTLGFRGEAVPSIASVSRFCLKTRLQDQLEGFEVNVRGGRIIESRPAGCAPGTRIEVRDIFFNVPARKKFMRTNATEERHIQETVYMLSLPHPEIQFELIIDGRRIFSSPAHQDLLPRLKTLFGKQYSENMLEVDCSLDGVDVKGFVARHGLTRNNRREQRTFVNGRPVEALPVFRGIRDGFDGMVEKGRFPPCVLFVDLDPHEVDVNVHPAKREIRLKHDYKVTRAVAAAVRNALRQAPAPAVTVDSTLPLRSILNGAQIDYQPADAEQDTLDFTINVPTEGQSVIKNSSGNNRTFVPKEFESPAARDLKLAASAGKVEIEEPDEPEELSVVREVPDSGHQKIEYDTSTAAASQTIKEVEENTGHVSFPGGEALKILGFIDATYILASGEDGLIIIDQHAAHERVMFEKMLKGSTEEPAQRLLLPVTLEFTRAEAAFIEKNKALLAQLGFEIEPLSSNTVMLNSIPASLRQENCGGLVRDLLANLLDEGRAGKTGIENVARAACKAAVKAHDHLSLHEARSLLRQMAECDMPFSCPHGRPTIISITLSELEKRFGRR